MFQISYADYESSIQFLIVLILLAWMALQFFWMSKISAELMQLQAIIYYNKRKKTKKTRYSRVLGGLNKKNKTSRII
jgi:hypothetical protein